MIEYFTCPRCQARIRMSTPERACWWCDSNLPLPIPAPSELARQLPEGYCPPRPDRKEPSE